MSKDKSLVEKKLRGSGGYAIAKVSDDEQKKANLGGPELFLAGVGRLEDDRFKKYYCNKCEKEYQGGPNIEFENPNEDLGENIILIEKGEYKCKTCEYVIAQYRKFNESSNNEKEDNKNSQLTNDNNNNRTKEGEGEQVITTPKTKDENKSAENTVKEKEQDTSSVVEAGIAAPAATAAAAAADNDKNLDSKSDYVQIEKITGMLTYDHNARLIGRVDEIGLRKTSDGRVEFSFKVKDSDNSSIREIPWNRISKIGDIIILLSSSSSSDSNTGNISKDNTNIDTSPDSKSQGKICSNCNYSNEAESVFCEECGKKLE